MSWTSIRPVGTANAGRGGAAGGLTMIAMGAEPTVEGGSLPAWLLELVTRTRVVVFCSELTDTRQLEQRLRGAGVEYGIQRMGMGSDAMRRRFGELRAFTRWSTLPQVFLDGRFVGGEPELAAGLQGPSAQRSAPLPLPALWLGLGGLLPFVAGASALLAPNGSGPVDWYAFTLSYGAVILAFLGGVQWGTGLPAMVAGPRAWLLYGVSVLAPLVAWAAYALSEAWAAALLLGGFTGVYLWDEWLLGRGWLPGWYLRLRRGLTAVVAMCLAWVMVSAL